MNAISVLETRLRIALTPSPAVLSVSPGIDAVLGYTADDFLSGTVSLSSRIHPDDQDIAETLFSPKIQPPSDSLNIRIRHADGRIRCIKGSYTKLKEDKGDRVILELILQDAKSLERTMNVPVADICFQAMMENTDDYIYFMDRNHVFTAASQTLVSLCSPAEHWTDLLNLTDYDVVTEELADIYYRLEKQVYAGIPVAREVQVTLTKDGRKGWADNRKYPVRNEHGEIIGLYGIARDITERKQAIASLQAAKDYAEYMINTANAIFVELDLAGNVKRFNPAAEQITGYTLEEVKGRNWFELIVPKTRFPEVWAMFEGLPVGGLAPHFENPILTKSGEERYIIWKNRALRENGQFTGVITFGLDITERKLAEEALRRSQEHLRVTLRSIGDAVIATDGEGSITLMNGVAEALTGWPESEAHGRQLGEVFRIINDETRSEVESPFHRVLAQGQVVGFGNHTLLISRSGTELPIADSGAPIRLGAGQPTLGVVVVFRDQTQERQHIADLAESERRFRALFEQAAVGVAQLETATGRFLRINRRYAEILGYEVEELMSCTCQAVTHADDLGESLNFMRALTAGRIREFRMEQRLIRKDGETVWVDLSVSPMWGAGEKPTWHVAVVEDISARKRAEAQIKRLYEELEQRVQERTAELAETVRELESYSYSVSHDLRAPLRAINGYTHLLLEAEQARMSEESKALLTRVIANTNKMEELIDDILLYVRAGRQPLASGELDIESLVRSIADELADSYPYAQILISALPKASGDPTMIKQIYSNLIGNALKFSSGREHPVVEVGASLEGGETVFYVKDNGVGFDMVYAGKLFGMFQRLHVDSQYPGTGIGLALVKRLIERQGGRVWAESQPEHGATFYFTLARCGVDGD